MKYFLFSLLFLSGCSARSFAKVGDAPVCLVKYEEKVIACSYVDINPRSVCFLKKDLKLKGGK
jgi:tRNA G37 N-methylase Trm5